jgi:hypothetical protein
MSTPPLIRALADPRAYGEGVSSVRCVETHISWVFLTGRYAYKIKKPVKLPFLDFSSLEQRRHFCEEELRLNRRLAGELYVAVVPIGGSAQTPAIGAQPAIEYAVKMHQFPDDARLDRRLRAGKLDQAPLVDFANRLAEFHRALPVLPNTIPPRQQAAAVVRAVLDNLADLGALVTDADLAARLEKVRSWTDRQCIALEPVIARRLAGRAHKECHGDLHLENLLCIHGKIVAFDALEFDPKLREIDVISEASFPTMDLLAHGRRDLAFAFIARYLEAGGDYQGIEVLRFYLVYRAMIRAKVRAIKAAQAPEADRHELIPYFDAARQLLAPRRPLLAITHGLSGSGKTHITDTLIGLVPALRVRSDLERKRLHGLQADEDSGSPIGGGLYAPDASAQTYGHLREVAESALRNHFDIIVDAAFLRRDERRVFQQLAGEHGARFAIIDCVAAPSVLRERIEKRAAEGRQASEASRQVLDYQLAQQVPLATEEHAATITVDTESAPDYPGLIARLSALE